MHRKIISIIAIIFLIATAVFLTFYNYGYERYHQHSMDVKDVQCNHTDGQFCTHLPLVKIDTHNQQIPALVDGSSVIDSYLSIFDKSDSNNHLDDEVDLHSLITIRARGNSSLFFDKKSYLIKLINTDRTENSKKIMGMESHDEWVLNGPILDKTLIRNYISMNLAGQMMKNAPDVRFCEVFINDEYMGIYVMMESVSRSKGRVDIAKYNENDPFTSYIVRLDRGSDPEEEINPFTRYTFNSTSIGNVIYPAKKYLNEQLITFIEDDISKFEKALYSYDYDDIRLGYRKYIDVMSFVDYLIINEFTQNYDAGIYSTYIFKDIKGKLEIGPVWDFNNAYDNYIETPMNTAGFFFQNKVWYIMLMKDEYFTNLVIKRYKDLRKTVLSEEYILEYIDQTVKYLGPAIERNFEKWGYTFVYDKGMLEPAKRNLKSYEAALNQLKEYIIARGKWIDENIDTLMQFSHESRNKPYNR
ncbi:MAG TPA: CotH kinase family protein [Clostridia bacterium]|nr:MAG: CotH protein [Firmicutes bacterium ADurb.Bin146]HOD93085.1 CotH kinase family protein [Clostridia bacterium]HQM39408.1 CotH kinase family protein [Clostridia bacterium]